MFVVVVLFGLWRLIDRRLVEKREKGRCFRFGRRSDYGKESLVFLWWLVVLMFVFILLSCSVFCGKFNGVCLRVNFFLGVIYLGFLEEIVEISSEGGVFGCFV